METDIMLANLRGSFCCLDHRIISSENNYIWMQIKWSEFKISKTICYGLKYCKLSNADMLKAIFPEMIWGLWGK